MTASEGSFIETGEIEMKVRFWNADTVYLEIVRTEPEREVIGKRQRIVSTVYALKALKAVNADNAIEAQDAISAETLTNAANAENAVNAGYD